MDSGEGDVGKEMPFIKLSMNTYSVFTLDFLTEISILCLQLMARKMSNNRPLYLKFLINSEH